MNKKFETLLTLLNNNVKSAQFRILYNNATNLERIELIGILQHHLNISEKSLNEIIKDTIKNL